PTPTTPPLPPGSLGDPVTTCPESEPAEIMVCVRTSDGTPVEGVSVSITELGLSGTTGADGVYDFGEVAPGSYTAVGQKDGYSPSTNGSATGPTSQTQTVSAGTCMRYDLLLDPLAAPPPVLASIAVHVQ